MRTPLKPKTRTVRHMGHTVTVFSELAQPGVAQVTSVPSSVFRERTARLVADEKSVPGSVSSFRVAENGFPQFEHCIGRCVPQNKSTTNQNRLWKKLDSLESAGWARTWRDV